MAVGTTLSIVVIEDHPELKQTIVELLERAGYSVACANDAESALELVRASRHPCILLWDPLTSRVTPSLLGDSALRGVHVATLPIGLALARSDEGADPTMIKRLTSPAAVLSVVREHCPQSKRTDAS